MYELDVNSTFAVYFGGAAELDGVELFSNGAINDVFLYNKITDEFSHRVGYLPNVLCNNIYFGSKGVYDENNQIHSNAQFAMWMTHDDDDSSKNTFFVFGGYGGIGDVDFNDLWEYSIDFNLWRWWIQSDLTETNYGDYEFHANNLPGPARIRSASFKLGINDEYLYILGGSTVSWGVASSALWVYSRRIQEWKFEHGGTHGFPVTQISSSGVIGSQYSSHGLVKNGRVFVWLAYSQNDVDALVLQNGILEYTGFNCYDIYYGNDSVCSSQGNCTSVDICECEGNYDPNTNCSTTLPIIIPPTENTNGLDYFEHIIGSFEQPFEDSVFTCDSSARISFREGGSGHYFRNHKIYYFGGITNNETNFDQIYYLNDVWSFDLTNNEYCFITGSKVGDIETSNYSSIMTYELTNEPSSRSFFSSFSSMFSFFVFGGIGVNVRNDNELWEFSVISVLTRNQWRILMEDNSSDPENTDQPSRRYGSCLAKSIESPNTVFLFGGQFKNNLSDVFYFNDLWEYDVQNNIFTIIRANNESVEFTENERFIVEDHYNKNENYKFSNPPRRSFCACWVEGKVGNENNFYIFGGKFPNSYATNDVWVFNTSGDSSWVFLAGGKNNSKENNFANNQIQHSYEEDNLPSTRQGMIQFTNQVSFFSENIFLLFGGWDMKEGLIWGGMWEWSNSQVQWKFLNGTSDQANVKTVVDMIGSRKDGVGVATPEEKIFIFGGVGV